MLPEHWGGRWRMLGDHGALPASRSVWILAAIGALAIHAGGIALALGYMRPDDSDDDLGAPAIEIGVELTSPHHVPTDLPVGPDTEASAPSPAEVAQKEIAPQTDVPKALPDETDDPERQVSPVDAKKPTQDDPKLATVQADPSEESSAAEETAAPSVENAPESPRSVAPSPGTGQSATQERVTWEKELAAHFNKYKRYPADRAVASAQVVVSFVLDRIGHVLSTRIVKGSGDSAFDQAALAMLQRSDPVPPPPPLVADDGLTFTLPVIFHAKTRE
jgi:periplasmic protein TonB